MPANEPSLKRPTSLGSKARSFIPMTPRSLKSPHDNRTDFLKQTTDLSHRGSDGQPPQKKFKSSAAPKGTKLASGYVDRTQERLREQENSGDDKQQRLKKLEELLKKEEIDQDTFDKLRNELGIGGDTSTTHLVKGLDFKLLERVRRGEDVTKAADTPEVEDQANNNVDVDDELEKALEKDVTGTIHLKSREALKQDEEHGQSDGSAAQPTSMTRDEILRRLKENRKKTGTDSDELMSTHQPQSTLDHTKFRKLDPKPKSNKHKFTETVNGRRREVLVITNKDGTTKRKTRWIDPEPDPSTAANGVGTNSSGPWGGDLPEELLARQKTAAEQAAKQAAEDDNNDDDIFGGVAEYDPLAGIESDDENKAQEDQTDPQQKETVEKPTEKPAASTSQPLKSTSARNYFATSTDANKDDENTTPKPAHDPAILAALKRAAQLRRQEEADPDAEAAAETNEPSDSNQNGNEARNRALLKKLQLQSRQDDLDMDLSFGGEGRFDEDDEDNGDRKQKLSEWKGIGQEEDDEDGEAGGAGGKSKRKRGGKKKKGDKNSYQDVMAVLEGRKKG